MKVNLVNENFAENYLVNLLKARGITDIERYLNPDPSCLNSPALMDNMPKGVKLLESILNKEDSRILLVVDCDVDGFTSSAIMYIYIKSIAPT